MHPMNRIRIMTMTLRFGTLNQALTAIAVTALTGLTLAGTATADTGTSPGTARHPGLLQQEAEAIHGTGVVSVLASVTGPDGRSSARAGVADLTSRQPVPPDAEFRIGSVTKTFV